MRILMLIISFLPASLALAMDPLSTASDPVAVYKSSEPYEDVRENLEMAITDRGMLITSTLHISDMLGFESADRPSAKGYMRPPQFVNENGPLEELLPRMRLSRQPMFLVTDQHSKVIGLVVLEDVIKMILGHQN